ncbi:MAG: type II toxin-antitoxin system VapC family toxin [bacterium]
MKKYVLDSFALIAYCEGEESGKFVRDILKKALYYEVEICVSVVNWGEMYYIALRERGKERAESYRLTISKYPITIVEANKELTLIAAGYKAFNKISYADAFAAALTEHRRAILVTGDKEFKSVEKRIKIHWI